MKSLGIQLGLWTVLLLGVGPGFADQPQSPIGKKVSEFTLQDYRGKMHKLSDYKDSKLLVVAFLGTECPLVKLYAPTLAKLAKEYAPKGVQFVGMNANVQDSVTEIAAYARRHNLEFPILKDLGNKVADDMGATRTPEIFVLDENRIIRYHGRIDDQFGVGYVRNSPQREDLRIAMDELLAGKQVTVAETKVAGCIIGRVQNAKADSEITYAKHVAPILQNRCVECHREGDIAPFALDKYEEVAGWAEMIAEVVAEGRMPPWHANPEYGHFANERRLTDQEKETIYQWVRNGAPRGNPQDEPAPRKFVTGWQLPREPDVIINATEKPFPVQAEGEVKYKFFRVDPGFTEDKWLQAAQIVPGNRAVVHHVLVFALPKDPNNAKKVMDVVRGGAGSFLVGYVPGQRPGVYPKGMAKKIPANSYLIFQMHYTPIGTPQEDQTKLGLIFADPKTITHEVRTRSAVNPGIYIKPKQDNQRFEATYPREGWGAPLENAQLLTLMPHMHLRGKAFRYEAIYPDGAKEILLDVPAFDFNWQTAYRLAEPKKVPDGTKIHCIAYYDNSENNLNNPDPTIAVRWGDQTWEEMMIGYFDFAVPVGQEEKDAPGKQNRPNLGALLQGGDPAKALMRFMDKDGDGKISREEAPQRLADRFDQVDRNRDGVVTMEELRAVVRELIRDE